MNVSLSWSQRILINIVAQGKEVNKSILQLKIGVVIPCFQETKQILNVIKEIGPEVSQIIVIDDACPDKTGEYVKTNCTDPRVKVITHSKNTGVGGATMSGYRYAIENGCEIIVKVDGDGQMDPSLIPVLVGPIQKGAADYVKGNRFHNLNSLEEMPGVRILGNLILSFASKVSSGYWNIFDPTNGFTAIHLDTVSNLPFDKIDHGFFFESDILYHLNMLRAVVIDIPMSAKYGNEESSLKIHNIILSFATKHYCNMIKRIFYSYFIRDFGISSIELVLGKILLLFGIIFGAFTWYESFTTGIPATAGTVILAALPIVLGSQLLIAFLSYDTKNIPTKPLNRHAT
ncbi:MAG: glycosyl transferase family 2 [Magnetovibrio sp.]|nr:glycosyl transferase family 2 [Magnetovibrio sp.]|tara:strand:+ start:419 stop:1453 length:1035 start_codon:yes stop_codon:yes gene_type:complete